MTSFKKFYSIAVFFFLGITGLFAQQPTQPAEVSDAELKQFASAYDRVQSIDQQLQQKMVSAIQKEELEIQKFNEILNAQQDTNKEADASEDELEKFNAAHKEIEKIQTQGQQDIQKVIIDNELTLSRYQEIMMAVQSDPELQQKLQKLNEEEK